MTVRAPAGDRGRDRAGAPRAVPGAPAPTFTDAGGGHIDADTVAVPASYAAALLAAGRRPRGGRPARRRARATSPSARCARPGHHATPTRSMGFCLLNNVAVTARALADRGERVLIVDYDAHHGNGTQDIFYADARRRLRVVPRVPALPGHRAASTRWATGDGLRRHHQLPAPGGRDRRRLPHRPSTTCWPRSSSDVAADVAAGVGRLRRPSPRSDHRSRPARPATSPTSPASSARFVAARPPGRVPRGRLRPRGRWPRRPAPRCRGAVRRGLPARGADQRRARACTWSRPCRCAPRGRPGLSRPGRGRPGPSCRPAAVPQRASSAVGAPVAFAAVIPDRLRPVLDETPPAGRALRGRRQAALPGRRHRPRPAARRATSREPTSTSTSPPTPARPRPSASSSGWADAVWTQGERFGTIGCQQGRPGLRDHDPPGRGLRPRTRASPTSSSPTPSRPTSRGATSPSTPWRSPLPEPELIDPFGGAADLAAGRLRTPLRPEESFTDDPLRMLRAARFIAGYGLEPDAGAGRRGRGDARPARDRVGRAHPRRARQAARRRRPVARACGSWSTPA